MVMKQFDFVAYINEKEKDGFAVVLFLFIYYSVTAFFLFLKMQKAIKKNA